MAPQNSLFGRLAGIDPVVAKLVCLTSTRVTRSTSLLSSPDQVTTEQYNLLYHFNFKFPRVLQCVVVASNNDCCCDLLAVLEHSGR